MLAWTVSLTCARSQGPALFTRNAAAIGLAWPAPNSSRMSAIRSVMARTDWTWEFPIRVVALPGLTAPSAAFAAVAVNMGTVSAAENRVVASM
ncbi:hypothetical protein ACFYW8_40455 [Streptomyces sp. NPDC002742]|uniref:hypothetical protein n=1 Tax=Streptomyces sp. NPDC002742 TaxID=3364663 RepID=UPI0036C0D5E1